MKKYLLIIPALLIVGFFAFNFGNNTIGGGTNHFESGGISFDYPNEWNITNAKGPLLGSYSDNNGLNVKVFKMGIPSGYSLEKTLQMDTAGKIDNNFKLTSQKNTTVNGTKIYEMDYTVTNKNGTQQRNEIWTQKNNILYSIILTTPNGKNVNLDSLVNSIKVNASNDKPIYRDWARLDFPKYNQEWIFDSYSLNDENAARHLTSFYPGYKGQMALLGHHTTHSAPFRNIKEFAIGDKVIVKDNLTQKKYTYEVTTGPNSDIRWGVEAEDIRYQATETPELWLITCWPPGYSHGAYIVHCKLITVEPLS